MTNSAHIINIAKGLYDEEDLKEPLTEEEKKQLEELKEYFKQLKEVGLEALVDAYSPGNDL